MENGNWVLQMDRVAQYGANRHNGVKNYFSSLPGRRFFFRGRMLCLKTAALILLTSAGSLPGADSPAGTSGGAGFGGEGLLNFQADLFTGRFSYLVPILVPPARQGAEPKLALSYNSATGNGWCGVGWGLDVGYIERDSRLGSPVKWTGDSPTNYYKDGAGFTFSLAGTGGKLVNVGTGEYRNEIDGAFLRFQSFENYWLVTDKSGNKFYFGQTSASRMENNRTGWIPDLFQSTYRWALDRIVDVNGNETSITYTNLNRMLYVDEILYNGHTSGLPKTHSIKFNLEDRTDISVNFRSNFRVTLKKRLSEIIVKVGTERVRRYALSYTNSSSTFRSLLQQVRMYGPTDADSLPPMTFSYQIKPFGFDSGVTWTGVNGQGDLSKEWTSMGTQYLGSDDRNTTYSILQDIDGDGLPDRVTSKKASPWNEKFVVQRNTGSNFVSSTYDWAPLTSQGITDAYWNAIEYSDDHRVTRVNFLDINRDGYPDRVMQWASSPYNKFIVETNKGVPGSSAFSGDIDWAPVTHESGTEYWWYGLSTTWKTDPYRSTYVDLIDITGDGLPDRVMRKESAPFSYFVYQKNTGSGFLGWQKWGDLISQGYINDPHWSSPSAAYNTDEITFTWHMLLDINGDGLPDRVARKAAEPMTNFVVHLNDGVGFAGIEDTSWGPIDSQGETHHGWFCPYAEYQSGDDSMVFVRMIDMNGDGLPDRVMRKMGPPYNNLKVQFNTGSSFTSSYNFGPLDGDDNDPWSHSPQWRDYEGSSSLHDSTIVDLVDINGDGLPDRVVWVPNSTTWTVQFNKGPFPDLLQTVDNGIGGKVDVTYVPSTSYNNRDRAWASDPWSEGAKSLLSFPVYTVSSITTSDGLGASHTSTYWYKGGMFDHKRREFRGFQRVKVTDPLGTKTITYFHQGGGIDDTANGEFDDEGSMVKKGLPYRVETWGTNNLLYKLTLNKVEEVMLHSNGWCFPYVTQSIQMDYEGLSNYRATATQLQYDTNTGNVVKSSNSGEVTNVVASTHSFTDVGSDAAYTHTTYATLSNTDVKNRPSSILISSDSAGTSKLRETLFEYEGTHGNLTTNKAWASNTVYIVTKSMSYDTYGNPLLIKDAAGITTTNVYDSTYQTFAVLRFTSGFTNQTLYDPKSGVVLSTVDPKGLVSSNIYDSFFRQKEALISTNAFGTANLWRVRLDYSLGGIANNISYNYIRRRTFDAVDLVNGHESYTYTDGFNRTAQTRIEAENGKFRVTDLLYDERGNVNFATLPYFSTGTGFTILSGTYLGAITDYDEIGRAARKTPAVQATFDANGNLTGVVETSGDTGSPVGPMTTVFSDGSDPWATVSTDSENKVRKSYHDAYGRIIRMVEVAGATNYNTQYKYDLMGQPTNVIDHIGNTTVMRYDNLGRKISMTESNLGTWTYAYDNADRITQEIDARGQKVMSYYDSIGRLSYKYIFNAGGALTNVVNFYYDTTDDPAFPCAKAQLARIIDKEGWQKFGYDIRGRVLKAARYISVVSSTYTIDTVYDDADRVSELVYPNNVARIKNTYDTGGNLSNVVSVAGTGAGKEYFYRLGTVDALGRVTAYTNGNDGGAAVATTNTFYANSKRLKQMRVTNPGGGYHQDLSYTFDKVSNLKSIGDAVYTGSASGSLSNLEYDDLHRLTRLDNASGTKRYAYNAIGNIITNQDTGTGQYFYNGGRPHAVSSANGKNYYYDAAGNMTGRGNQSLSYDEENRLTQVVDNTALTPTIQFGYAHDGTRLWRRKGSSIDSVWVGGIFETRGVKTLCHVFANGKRVATFEPAGGGPYAGILPGLKPLAKQVERAVMWPLQEGRTPWTILIAILLGYLLVSVGSRWLDARDRGEALRLPRLRPAPFWHQFVTLLVIVSLLFSTTETNVYAQVYNPVFYYYHSDHLGSSNVLTDRAGVRVQLYQYSAYGPTRFTENGSAFHVSNLFTDQVFDEDTGLYYYGSRYYDPESGRFIQPDSVVPEGSNPQTLNRYTYADNNPLKYVDPSGNFAFLAFLIAVVVTVIKAAIIGAVVSVIIAAIAGGDIGKAALEGALTGAAGAFGGIIGIALKVAVAAARGQDVGKAALMAVAGAAISFAAGAVNAELISDGVVDTLGESVKYVAVKTVEGAASGATKAAINGEDVLQGALEGAKDGGIGAVGNTAGRYLAWWGKTKVYSMASKNGWDKIAGWTCDSGYEGAEVDKWAKLTKPWIDPAGFAQEKFKNGGETHLWKSLQYIGKQIGAKAWSRKSDIIEALGKRWDAMNEGLRATPQPQIPSPAYNRMGWEQFDRSTGDALRVK